MLSLKHRFRFRKTGSFRLISHLDLLRSFERALRRAQIPFAMTQGFHPSPRLMIILSLPLGMIGQREVLELELTEPLASDELLVRINQQLPDNLHLHTAKPLEKKQLALPRRTLYAVPLPCPTCATLTPETLLQAEKIWVQRLRPQPREVNIRPYLRGVTVTENQLLLDIWSTPNGSARADEIVALLLPETPLETILIERLDIELHDELSPENTLYGDSPPVTLPETRRLIPRTTTVALSPGDATPRKPHAVGGVVE